MVVLAPSVLAIKEIHATFVRQYGVDGYMCEGMVEGCLERAMTYVYDFKPFPKLFMKAAAILYAFITFHPFVDGNKRTAFETTKLFLRLNGYELIAPKAGVDFTRAIASRKVNDVEEIAKWLRTYSQRKISYIIASYLLKVIIQSYYKSTKVQQEKMPQNAILLVQATRIFPD